ncbi:hypothetical protein CFP56_015899 [Quercus suber]|uniref:CCHC-type domain-containing protein n=1 Tax=Quercus suber TaxID=58331 RepID=A0AAW0M1K3_QUESU
MEEDIVSDDEEEQDQEGSTRVCFSKEEKICMRDPWRRALIIKTFGRRLGFSILVEKIRSIWNPTGGMDYINFFLVKFELAVDVDYILKGGPWLPELPIEFYETNAFLKIGRAIGPVLRIDSYTANGVRGRFARLCVQVNLDKPLLSTKHIGKIVQSIQYEGIKTLCFTCGRVGHKMEACPHVIKEYTTGPTME